MTVVVKLGGSVVTEKGGSKPVYRKGVVDALAKELARCGERVVLVHGGGSFGHPVAARYRLSSSPSLAPAEGVSKTRDAMLRLDRLVCGSLSSAGVSPYPFAPFTLLERTAQASGWLDALLDAGLTPITFGDVVVDGPKSRILSGDTIACELSRIMRAERCVFALDVGGALAPDGSVMRVFRKRDLGGFGVIGGAADATGGIRFKLAEALRAASSGTSVSLVSGRSPADFAAAILGREFRGTSVRP